MIYKISTLSRLASEIATAWYLYANESLILIPCSYCLVCFRLAAPKVSHLPRRFPDLPSMRYALHCAGVAAEHKDDDVDTLYI